jgi:hypothetical protein
MTPEDIDVEHDGGDNEFDMIFSSLPSPKRRKIDSAFDSVHKSRKRPQGHNCTNRAQTEAVVGGFILDDESSTAVGQESPADLLQDGQILLSSIPDALQILDIQPDDPEIHSVFRKAATGWGARGEVQELYVSRDDFRSVCAVLLEGPEPGPQDEECQVDPPGEYRDEDDQSNEDAFSGDDQYGGDDGEYVQGASSRRNPKPTRKRKRVISADHSDTDSSRSLTSRQIRECRRAFALFFPESGAELSGLRLTIKDMTRVAEVLREKLRAEEARVHCSF